MTYPRGGILPTRLTTIRGCSCLGLVFWAQMRIREPRGHVEHEGIVELAQLVGHVDVLAASFQDNLAKYKTRRVGENNV